MANMGYCRFQNTLDDLLDCEEHFFETELSDREAASRKAMIKVMIRILGDLGYDVEGEDE